MRTYEWVLVVQPGLDEEGLDGLISGVTATVVENGGQVVDVEHMGRRRLAYTIKKATEGHYVLMHLNLENPSLIELERRVKLNGDILRHLVIRMDELLEPAPEAPAEVAEATRTEDTAEGAAEPAAEPAVDEDDLAAELADELAEGPDSEA